MGKGHAKNEDQYLDKDGVNEVLAAEVKDSVDKKHTQNTDDKITEGDSSVEVVDTGIGYIKITVDNAEVARWIDGGLKIFDKLAFTQTDGNEYIDSLADGYLDYKATTSHRFGTDGDSTNYFEIKSDGEVNLYGTARVKKLIPIANANLGKGGTVPTQVIIGNYNSWEYDINDDSVFTFHLPTDWASGTDVVIYIDWYIDEAGGDEIKWQIEWSATPHNSTEPIDSPTHTGTDDTGDIVIPVTAKYLTQDSITISGANLSVEDQLGIKLSRIAITDGVDPTNNPAIVDIHIGYTSDKLGEAT